MDEKTENNSIYEIDDFKFHSHLWNLIPSGQGKGIVLLRSIIDAIQANNYSRPGNKLPSILIIGEEGKKLTAIAIANSLQIEDIRECKAVYLDNGISSFQHFCESTTNTAHILTDVNELKPNAESALWRYLSKRRCSYFNFLTKNIDNILFCNGLIIMTSKDIESVSIPIIKETDYIVELEPFTTEQLKIIVHQRLKFCGIRYEGEEVLQAIVGAEPVGLKQVMQFLKRCVIFMQAEYGDCLSLEMVEKVKRLSGMAVETGDDIPF